MCYSKEVSLFVAGIMYGCIFLYFLKFYDDKNKKFKKFLMYAGIAGIFIATHQLFEFFSILYSVELIFKVGLVFSISSMIFFMKSLEAFTNHDFKSNYFIPIILIVIVSIIYTPMSFINFKFWVRGYSHTIWVAAWLLLFVYWNVCIVYLITKTRKVSKKKTLLYYAFEIMDISFVLAVLYLAVGAIGSKLYGLNDFPSIWCTFSFVQLLFLPHIFLKIKRNFIPQKKVYKLDNKTQLTIIVVTIIIFVILWTVGPQIPLVASKMFFK